MTNQPQTIRLDSDYNLVTITDANGKLLFEGAVQGDVLYLVAEEIDTTLTPTPEDLLPFAKAQPFSNPNPKMWYLDLAERFPAWAAKMERAQEAQPKTFGASPCVWVYAHDEAKLACAELLEAEHAAAFAQQQAKREEARLAREKALADKQAHLAAMRWTGIGNLIDMLFEQAELERDTRFSHYAYHVEALKDTNAGQISDFFKGGFVDKGTIALAVGRYVFIVASDNGSRKNHNYEYRVVILNNDGSFTRTEIKDDANERGYWLRIREQIRDLL